ncbi:alpha/beta-hydrolase [Gonapodya prolifera JEL478]|uniref:Alpha/beta-hydrolase n=1 Tax=Gonapodya prolifera (strain JEL478) TaxID=1344416 RepID=A0A139A9E5_GONPJ|nr:alpha/beta-hydrolase [Gonapodya prolifera JEL478]|eukprot:KXS13288.1 alpha/beta-hydrolase [Gonapodya prolifera JEL478]
MVSNGRNVDASEVPRPSLEEAAAMLALKPHKTGKVHVAKSRRPEPVSLYYELWGTGKRKVMFIMGLNMSAQQWEFQVKYFGSRPDYQALCFDNRGVGFSSAPSGFYSTSEMAVDAYELMVALGPEWTKDVHVVGVSMGGMILQELALLAPPRTFASFSLLSTTAGRGLPPFGAFLNIPRMAMTRNHQDRLSVMIPTIFPTEWLSEPPSSSFGKAARDPEGKPYKTNLEWSEGKFAAKAALVPQQPPQGALGQLAAAMAHHLSASRLDKMRKLGVETLVMTGTWDNLVRPENSTYLAHHLRAPLVVFEGSGHAILSEKPDETNAHLLTHFERAQARVDRERRDWDAYHEEDFDSSDGEASGSRQNYAGFDATYRRPSDDVAPAAEARATLVSHDGREVHVHGAWRDVDRELRRWGVEGDATDDGSDTVENKGMDVQAEMGLFCI